MAYRWSEEELKAYLARQPGTPPSLREPVVHAKKISANNRYRAQETWVDSIRFPSKLEARHYVQLKILKERGEIIHFHRQVPFDLGGGVRHLVDWLVVVPMTVNVRLVYADSKGFDTPTGKMKRKLVHDRYPSVEIALWKKDVEL